MFFLNEKNNQLFIWRLEPSKPLDENKIINILIGTGYILWDWPQGEWLVSGNHKRESMAAIRKTASKSERIDPWALVGHKTTVRVKAKNLMYFGTEGLAVIRLIFLKRGTVSNPEMWQSRPI